MSDFFSLILFMLLALIGWFIFDTMKALELARLAGRQGCAQRGVQFLDDSVVGARLRLSRDSAGRRVWLRSYRFEFSPDGNMRLQGQIELQGSHIKMIDFEAYQFVDVTPVSENDQVEVKSNSFAQGRTYEAEEVRELK